MYNNNNNQDLSNKNEVALWVKTDKNGNEYFSVKVTQNGVESSFLLFRNKFKANEKQPDFKTMKERPQQSGQLPQNDFEKFSL